MTFKEGLVRFQKRASIGLAWFGLDYFAVFVGVWITMDSNFDTIVSEFETLV